MNKRITVRSSDSYRWIVLNITNIEYIESITIVDSTETYNVDVTSSTSLTITSGKSNVVTISKFEIVPKESATIDFTFTTAGNFTQYFFEKDGKYYISDKENEIASDAILLRSSKQGGVAKMTVSSDAVINQATIESNLTNCTMTSIDAITQDVAFHIEFTPNSDVTEGQFKKTYSFSEQPTLSYYDSNSVQHTITATDNVIDATITDLLNGSTATITATAIENTELIYTIASLNFNLVNAEIDTSNSNITSETTELQSNQNYYIRITPNENQNFKSSPYIEYVDNDSVTNKIEFENDGIHTYYTANFTLSSLENGSTVNIVAIAGVNTANVEYSLTNCTSDTSPSTYSQGNDLTLQFTSENNSYKFATQPIATYTDSSGTTHQIDGSITDDNNASITIPSTIYIKDNSTITITAIAIVSELAERYFTIYKPTLDQLTEMSKKRFYTTSGASSATEIDLTQYITSLKETHFKLTPEGVKSLVLGFYNTNIIENCFINEKVSFDCGNISVAGFYNNSIDFNNTSLTLNAPFISQQELSTDKYMNKKVNLKYEVSLYDLSAYIILTDTETNNVIDIFSGNVGFNIPYLFQSFVYGSVLNAGGNLRGGGIEALYSITPSITVNTQIPIDNYEYYGIDTQSNVTIKDCKGWNIFDNITLPNNSIPLQEIDLITNALKNGIEINDV